MNQTLLTIDPKGRIHIPSKIREKIGDSFVCFDGLLLNCVQAYSHDNWRFLLDRINMITRSSERDTVFRHIAGTAIHCEVDGQGRMHIAERYRVLYQINDVCIIEETQNGFELWGMHYYIDEVTIPTYSIKKILTDRIDRGEFDCLLTDEIMSYDRQAFLCHSSADKIRVKKIGYKLVEYGIKPWIDEWEIMPGDSLIDKIQQNIDRCDYFLVMLSKDSVTSNWCRKEINLALMNFINERGAKIIPVLLEDCDIPGFLRELLYVDLRKGNNVKELSKLISALK